MRLPPNIVNVKIKLKCMVFSKRQKKFLKFVKTQDKDCDFLTSQVVMVPELLFSIKTERKSIE